MVLVIVNAYQVLPLILILVDDNPCKALGVLLEVLGNDPRQIHLEFLLWVEDDPSQDLLLLPVVLRNDPHQIHLDLLLWVETTHLKL